MWLTTLMLSDVKTHYSLLPDNYMQLLGKAAMLSGY